MTPGLVSVIIPAYNQGQYLGKAVESVLAQTYSHFEIIIVDDGSTDDTAEIGRRYAVPNVHYFFQANRGLSAARNTGLQHAQGEYISYLDSDDLFLPDKLLLLVEALDLNPDWGLVAGQAIPIDEADQPVGKIYTTPVPDPAEQLLLGNPLHVGSVLVRKSWQDQAGEFDESLRSYEDWDMWLRLIKLGCPMGWVPKPVSLYRFHSAQMTRIGRQMTNATFAVLDKAYSKPDVPPSWIILKDQAYSNAFLRAMAQAYHAGDYAQAQKFILQAVELYPLLGADQGELLSGHLSALAASPKIREPLDFLAEIYANLPEEFHALRMDSPKKLSQFAIEEAFDAYACQDYPTVRKYVWRALRYQPSWLKNRGVLSVFGRSFTRPVIDRFFSR